MAQNFASLRQIEEADVVNQNYKLLEQNDLIIDKNKNKRIFQEMFFKLRKKMARETTLTESNESDSEEGQFSVKQKDEDQLNQDVLF